MSLNLVLPFCSKDSDIALQNLQWMKELDGNSPFHCILSHDDETSQSAIRLMQEAANGLFKSVETFWYPAPEKKYWPAGANWAFQNVARYMAAVRNESWLFLEADAIPLKKGWLSELAAEYVKGNRPFMGHVVTGMGHPNGVAIYPPMVALYSQGALMVQDTAWDVVIGHEVPGNMIHNANFHFMHAWAVDKDGNYWNGDGSLPTFRSVHDIVAKIDLTACVFHRCKDGSLIKWLREFYKAPHKAMVPQHAEEEHEETKTNVCTNGSRLDEANNEVDEDELPIRVEDATVGQNSEEKPVDGTYPKTEILIVTYWKDFPWLAYALKCIHKHAKGFQGVTLAVPDKDVGALNEQCAGFFEGVTVKPYKEVEGKGMLQHMAVMATAEEVVPAGTEFVLHMDADCMFKEPVTPATYIKNEKPYYVVRSYDSLIDSKTRVVSDCMQWKPVVEDSLRTPVTMYTMCRHPSVFPIAFYKRFRNYIQSKQGMGFLPYVLSRRNEFPQTFADFPTMGAFAYQFMRDKFEWVDISAGNHLAPKDKLMAFWSHGGITEAIKQEIEGFLSKPEPVVIPRWKPSEEELERMAQ